MSNVLIYTGGQLTLGDGTPVVTYTEPGVFGVPPLVLGSSFGPKIITLPATAFQVNSLSEQSGVGGAGKVITLACSGAANSDFATWHTIQPDFTRVIKWEVFFLESASGPPGNVAWRLTLKKVPTGTSGVLQGVFSDTYVPATGNGDTFIVAQLVTPALAFQAGDLLAILVERRANSVSGDPLDTCDQAMGFAGIRLTYE